MRHCSTPNNLEQELRAWKLQFLFGKCVLRQQPEIRGGKKKRLKRNETLGTGLLDSLTRWNEGRVDELWTEACKLYPSGDRPIKPQSLASNIRRATECAQDARYGKAVAALLSLGTCPMSEETLKEMRPNIPKRSCRSSRLVLLQLLCALMLSLFATRWRVSPPGLRRVPQVRGLSF